MSAGRNDLNGLRENMAEATVSNTCPVVLAPREKLLIDMEELAQLTSLSTRHLRRLDSSQEIPGRVVSGRRVLFRTDDICEWVKAGMPNRDRWPASIKRNSMEVRS